MYCLLVMGVVLVRVLFGILVCLSVIFWCGCRCWCCVVFMSVCCRWDGMGISSVGWLSWWCCLGLVVCLFVIWLGFG